MNSTDETPTKGSVDFVSQMLDVNVNKIGKGIGGVVPELLKDHCPGYYPVLVAHEVLQEVEVFAAKPDWGVATAYCSPGRINY